MGLPVQQNAPQITVNGRTFGVSAFIWNTPDGVNYTLGIYEQTVNGWVMCELGNYIQMYVNAGDMVADVAKRGGAVAYLKWFVEQVNALFLKFLGAVVPPSDTNFKTDDEAIAWMSAQIGLMKLTLVNGVPVLA